MRVPCDTCGVEHELGDLEPSYAHPDAWNATPRDQPQHPADERRDFCVIPDADGNAAYFIRVLLPMAVHGDDEPCCWGLWTEVSRATYDEVTGLWDDASQTKAGPWPAVLANHVNGYPPTLGLAGTLRFADPRQIPHFAFAPEVVHPLAVESRDGVAAPRVVEWLLQVLHDDERWPFDQEATVAAVTTRAVTEEGHPVLLVVHYAHDHSWAFLTGAPFDTSDGRITLMGKVLRRDPTLRQVADLPPGWLAERESVGGRWSRKPNPDDADDPDE